VVDSKLGVDGIEHRRFAGGRIVSRDDISRGSQCRHGHPRRGRQPRHDHTIVKGRVERGGATPRLGIRRPPRVLE
jgi:hypothetical protein